jgi:hypothetical protein
MMKTYGLYIYKELISSNGLLLGKLIVPQLIREFSAFMEPSHNIFLIVTSHQASDMD